MRVLATWIMAIGLVALPATAATRGAGDDTSPAPKPADAAAAKNKAADKSAAPAKSDTTAKTDSKTDSTNLENELQQLRDLLLAQSKQIQEQSDELKAQQQKMDSLENQLNSSSAARTISTPSGTPGTSTGESVSIPAAGPMATATVSSGSPAPTSGEASPAQGMDADGPNSIHFKGVTLTPGGFFAAETAWRGKALGADVNTPFNSVPVPGSSQSDLHEFF